MPFPLASPFSIRRFNFFCLQVLLTRASLLALAKSIYYTFVMNSYFVDLISQLSRDVIGCLSVKDGYEDSKCHWCVSSFHTG